MLGREVGLVGGRADDRSASAKCTHRDLRRAPPAASSTGSLGQRARSPGDHAGDHLAQHGQHVAMVVDEAELDVERDVLRQVAHRVVRLGPEDRPDLVDPLEDADHLLLVELRALREVRRPAEVVDLRTRWRPDSVADSTNFGVWISVKPSPSSVERKPRSEAAASSHLHLLGRVPPGHRGVVEQRRERDVERGPPQLERRCLGVGSVSAVDDRVGDLDAAGGLRVGGRRADDLDGGLLGRHGACPAGSTTWARPVRSRTHEEGDPGQLAAPVHPAPAAVTVEPGSAVGRACATMR